MGTLANRFGIVVSLLLPLVLAAVTPPALAQSDTSQAGVEAAKKKPAQPAGGVFFFGPFEAPWPGINPKTSIDSFASQDRPLTTLVATIVNYLTAAIIALSLIAIMIGGYLYMMSGADPGNVETAKTWIKSALFGIVLALTAWLILNTINPQITHTTI